MHDTDTLRQGRPAVRRALAFVTAAAALALLALSPATGFAHGGGLDRQGCHRETATGGYHCHRPSPPSTETPPAPPDANAPGPGGCPKGANPPDPEKSSGSTPSPSPGPQDDRPSSSSPHTTP